MLRRGDRILFPQTRLLILPQGTFARWPDQTQYLMRHDNLLETGEDWRLELVVRAPNCNWRTCGGEGTSAACATREESWRQ